MHKATAVLTHFRNRMFKGDLSQSIQFCIRDYETCAEQLQLDASQKVSYFVNILQDSPRFFFYSFYVRRMDFKTVCEKMRKEYNSDSRQLQVQSNLETLRLAKFMEENEISSVSEGLTKVFDYIERLLPNVH
eukprot:IDg4860t1